MTDYTDLPARMREHGSLRRDSKDLVNMGAAAIEALIAERDALLRDVWRAHVEGMEEGIGSPFPTAVLIEAGQAAGASRHQMWDAGLLPAEEHAEWCDYEGGCPFGGGPTRSDDPEVPA